jgi:hypothetical protein
MRFLTAGSRLVAIPPHSAFLILLLCGFALVFVSYGLGIHSIYLVNATTPPEGHQVGYLYALNWSINYAILLPLSALFALSCVGLTRDTIQDLLDSKMVVTVGDFAVADPEEVLGLWKSRLGRVASWSIPLIAAIAIYLSYEEWYRTNFRPLLLSSEPDQGSIDWGIGVILIQQDSTYAIRLLNAFFDLVAFSLQALLITLIVSFFVVMFSFAWFVYSDLAKQKYHIVPNLRSDDPRLGFEVFGTFLNEMIITAFAMYSMGYLSRLQNIYLRCSSSPSLIDFVKEDIIDGASSIKQDADNIKDLLSTEPAQAACPGYVPLDLADIVALMCTGLSALVVLMIVVLSIRETAKLARWRAKNYLTRHGVLPHLVGMLPELLNERLKNMVVWPLQWPKLNTFLVLCAGAVGALIFYRVGLLVLGLLLPLLIRRMIGEFT